MIIESFENANIWSMTWRYFVESHFVASAFTERRSNETDMITGRFNALSSSSLAYPAIKIPHDYSRLPPMNIAPARSLHILLKATKEFL